MMSPSIKLSKEKKILSEKKFSKIEMLKKFNKMHKKYF